MASLKERVLARLDEEAGRRRVMSPVIFALLRVLRDAVEREEDVLPLGHLYQDNSDLGGPTLCVVAGDMDDWKRCKQPESAHAPQPGLLTRATAAALGIEEA